MEHGVVAVTTFWVGWTLLLVPGNGARLALMLRQASEVDFGSADETHPLVPMHLRKLRTSRHFMPSFFATFTEEVAGRCRRKSLGRIFLLGLLRVAGFGGVLLGLGRI
jgi:hypothetical protein